LKVHAKVALIKKKQNNRSVYYGLFATGNLNESTARFYTDHILLTSNHTMLRELELLFIFLTKRRKPKQSDEIQFQQLLVAQFNLQQTFLDLIDEEINNANNGLEASITIKLNNLEEKQLISKLYEASNAGVKINLIVRSICCLMPNVAGQSENINIKRIVDRYLEHGRVFIFHNNGYNKIYLGSSDWMNRNIYRRIEVCFPIHDEALKSEIQHIVQLQLNDNVNAVQLDSEINNIPIIPSGEKVQSQKSIYELLSTQ
jgi:polyphosphate kinase